jgi:hypothetical protein
MRAGRHDDRRAHRSADRGTIAPTRGEAHKAFQVMSKPGVAQSQSKWTRAEAYLGGLALRRLARRARRLGARSEPEAPRLILSTIPFAALIAVLGLLIVAFAITAWPGSQPETRERVAQKEVGTAQPGWFDEAKKEMK